MLFDTFKNNHSFIKEIYLFNNKQIDYNCMKLLGEYIKSNKSIERILLNDTSISNAGIEILAPYLDGNTTFKQLHLSYNKGITDKSIPLLIKMIESSCIEDIDIYDTSITQKNTIDVLSVCNGIKYSSISLDLQNK